MARMRNVTEECPVQVTAGKAILNGSLCIPEKAQAVVIFAHGSGSSRLSPRNQYVAARLRTAGLATLLFDLLTQDEEDRDITGQFRFNIKLLSERLVGATDWLKEVAGAEKFKVGYFGASTGAAAALVAAAERPDIVSAVVSRGGRPDLAGDALSRVKAPVLLIVGGNDAPVIDMNHTAMRFLKVEKRLDIVPGATHLFEEPGKLEKVADLAKEWFLKHLGR
ncbi:MAG: dienelactone hydrolase family protein [Dehalococcoidales bacterium]|nr:dienelactone hydrolase family protein [Dehalococcoidales bacterium]